MTCNPITYPYSIKLWSPHTGTYAAAASNSKITMKAPEIGDSYATGREQSILRTRSGAVVAYDYGVVLNGDIKLRFEDVPNDEFIALRAMLALLNYGTTTLAYQDPDDIIRKVRVATPVLDGRHNGYVNNTDVKQHQLWNFELDLIDVTANP